MCIIFIKIKYNNIEKNNFYNNTYVPNLRISIKLHNIRYVSNSAKKKLSAENNWKEFI